jgi:hypothetical protein
MQTVCVFSEPIHRTFSCQVHDRDRTIAAFEIDDGWERADDVLAFT